MSNTLTKEIIDSVKEIACHAGDAIMDIYNTNFDVELKNDDSPLTEADRISNEIILKSLKKINPQLPILSEESSDISFKERSGWGTYWLVDPLDGTKEFIKKNGEFTVNIALIENNTPTFGVIRVPTLSKTYWGAEKIGSIREIDQGKVEKIQVSNFNPNNLRVISSRSHKNKVLNSYLKKLGSSKKISIGSSLKFCLLAEGKADFYPRLGPTSEWDTAAGEAILKFSGGFVLSDKGEEMLYNKSESFLNPYFIASSNEELIKEFLGHYKKSN